MKKVEVTSCSHSHGRPISRVTMSQTTDRLKAARVKPHSIISNDSSQSSCFHLSCRWRCSTSERSSAIRYPTPPWLFDRADGLLDLRRVRAEILGHLFEIGRCHLDESRLVDAGHD